MIYFYSSPCNLTGVRACRALNSLGSLTDCTHPPSTLCLLGEGVSWIWSRRAGKQRSKGSEVFQLSPAFFSPLADGSQMFLADTLSVFVLFIPPVSLSLLSRILLASSIQCFPLFRSRTLDKSACFTLSDRNRPSPNKRSFSTLVLLFCVSSFPHPCFSFVCFFPSLSSFITHHLVWLRATAYCFSYSVPDLLMFLLCLTTDQTAFTIKCIAHVKTLWL